MVAKWSIITAGFALAFAAAFGALGQGEGSQRGRRGDRAQSRARPATSAARCILGLVLIESLVIYVLLISLILFFLKPFGG